MEVLVLSDNEYWNCFDRVGRYAGPAEDPDDPVLVALMRSRGTDLPAVWPKAARGEWAEFMFNRIRLGYFRLATWNVIMALTDVRNLLPPDELEGTSWQRRASSNARTTEQHLNSVVRSDYEQQLSRLRNVELIPFSCGSRCSHWATPIPPSRVNRACKGPTEWHSLNCSTAK